MTTRILTLALAFLALPAHPQTAPAEDPDFAASVKQWTTKPEFLSPLVDHLPKVANIPTPKDVLGYHIGAPQKLTYYADILKYYRALAAASPRVRILEIGKTDEGRECVVIAIASEDTIKDLDKYRDALSKLADPRALTEPQAKEIIASAKPVYHLMGGLHSAETGPSEMLMELAYRLVAEDSGLIKRIRDNIIVTITPVAEPDGRDRYLDWYYAYKINEKTEDDRLPSPPFWGKYVYHDNNRDINYSQVTMRNLLAWYLQWHPPIMHDLHESVPFLYTFSGQSPQNPTLDPILYAELPWFANYELTTMARFGMPGVWTHAFVDMWSPGYLGFMSSNHNGMLRMYETFGNGGGNTMKRKVTADRRAGGNDVTKREWYRPLPPYPEVEWSMRNNTNYSETAVLSALQLTSNFPKVVLENFYQKSRNSIESGRTQAPFGYVIPGGQKDMNRVTLLVNLLRRQGIEVGRATSGFQVKEGSFPEGSFVIKLDQPYGRLAKILLEKQSFPDANLRTYDDTGWTMGLMINVPVKEVEDKAVLAVAVQPVDKFEWKGVLSGFPARAAYVIPHYGANALITLRCRLRDLKFEAAEKAFVAAGVEYPAGSLLIPVQGPNENLHQRIKLAVEELGLPASSLETLPEVPRHEVEMPRLAVFSTWGNTQDVGWVRYALDQFEVPYDLIYKERIKSGNLRAAYDVILMPSQGRGDGKSIVYDVDARGKILAYKKTGKFKNLGMYGESDDISGGMGIAGVAELEKFLNAGGVLITLGAASWFPADFGLAPRVDAAHPSPAFYAPGPIVNADIQQPTHPLFYGYTGKTIPVRYANGPLLTVPDLDKKEVLLRFSGSADSVLSGLMKGSAETRNKAAVVDVPAGAGRILMFATNPCYRWQNHGEFNMLFNAILHFNDLR
jgi:hypothetical protein